MKKLVPIFIILFSGIRCKEEYIPPTISSDSNILVVDGMILSGNDSSIIKISRTRNLSDTSLPVYELNAKVTVLGSSGIEYFMTEQGRGRYYFDQLYLDLSQQYQLKIITSDGNEFRSDMSVLKTSPPIDSIFWRQNSDGVNIYLDSHDPNNNTKYYRWDYLETWSYLSAYYSSLNYVNDLVVYRGVSDQVYTCYQSQSSSSINVATTAKLSNDVIQKQLIANVPTSSEKISSKYSIQVRQYAIQKEGYNYWENLKKNTEQLGTIFDLQPFTELGNIRCMNNPHLNCLGYISFSTLQEQRIFITNSEVNSWNYYPYYGECVLDTIPPSNLPTYFPPGGGPYNYSLIGLNFGNYVLSTKACVDCSDHGGTEIKPSYWP